MHQFLKDYGSILSQILRPGRGGRPRRLILFITSQCNARCRHCFYCRKLNAGEDLAFPDIVRLSRSLGRLATLSLSGGEPFLSPLLGDTCRLFARENRVRRIQIPTNGLLPQEIADQTEAIIRSCPVEVTIAISLDGLEAIHDRIRGREGAFNRARETYRRLAVLKPPHPNLRLVTNTVICNQNLEGIEPLFAALRRDWPELDSVNYDWVRGTPASPGIVLPPIPECRKLKPALLTTKAFFLKKSAGSLRTILELAFRDYLFDADLKTLSERRQVIPCLAPLTYAVVYASGECSFCEMLPPFGNIKDADLAALAARPEARRLRKLARQGKCFCVHGCHQPYNLAFNPRHYPGIAWRLRDAVRWWKRATDGGSEG